MGTRELNSKYSVEELTDEDVEMLHIPVVLPGDSRYTLSMKGASVSFEVNKSYPIVINAQPTSYQWKEIVTDGEWTKEGQAKPVIFNKDKRDILVKDFNRMKKAGRVVYVPKDHSQNAADNLGFVVELRNHENSTYGLLQLIGEDAALIAARNNVSICGIFNYTDTDGMHYDFFLEHVALTPVPVLTKINDLKLVASRVNILSRSTPMPGMTTSELLNQLKMYLPGGDTMDESAVLEHALSFLMKLSENVEKELGSEEIASLSREDIYAKHDKQRKAGLTAIKKVAELKDENLKLSKKVVTPLGEDVVETMVDALRVKRDSLVSKGSLNPATASLLFNRLVQDPKGNTNHYALSKTSSTPTEKSCLALSILTILESNKPIPLDEETGLQHYSKTVKPEDTEEEKRLNKAKAARSILIGNR